MTRAETVIESWLARVPVGFRTNPFEAWIAVFGAIGGVFYLAGVSQSTALAETLPDWAQRAWGALLLVSCLCLLRGLWQMVDVDGIVSLRGRGVAGYKLGLRLMITACAVYAPAVFWYANTNAAAAATPYLGLGSAALLRLLVIRVASARTSGWHR